MSTNKEVACLQEELERCKADKEFVWSLWKQLQKQSPDITEAIGLVVTREKAKRDVEFQQLLGIKEEEISLLQKETEAQMKKISVLENQICYEKELAESFERQESALIKEQSARLQEASKEIAQLCSKIEEKDKEIERQKQLVANSADDKEMIKDLMRNNEELLNERQELTLNVKELESKSRQFNKQEREMEGRLSSMQLEYEEELKSLKSSVNIAMIERNNYERVANEVTQQLKSTQKELEDTKDLLAATESRLHDNQETSLLAAGPKLMDQLKDYQKLLERTERELFETKMELSTKKEELEVLREKHERRLQRMKSLSESHALVLQQLKTYETSSDDQNKPPALLNKSQTPLKGNYTLQQENTAELWSQLVLYKSKYEEMRRDKMVVEEELDSLSATCAQYKTNNNELRISLEEKQSLLREKEGALYELKRVASCTSLEKERGEKRRQQLKDENKTLQEENRLLKKDCCRQKEAINYLKMTLHELQSSSPPPPPPPPPSPPQSLNKSTMTEQLKMINSYTQVNIMPNRKGQSYENLPTETSRLARSHSFSAHQPVYQTETQTDTETHSKESHSRVHRRRFSDGDLLASYHLLSKALNKLSQTIHPPHPSPPPPPPPPAQPKSSQSNTSDKNNSSKSLEQSHLSCSHSGSTHKCKWYAQLKSTRQRAKTLMQQVAVLTEGKNAALKSLEEVQKERERLEAQVKPLQDKVASQKVLILSLKEDLKLLENSYHALQGRCSGLQSVVSVGEKRGGGGDDEIKQYKTEKKVLTEKCSAMNDQLKVLQTELALIEKERESFQEKCSYMERDLKHKRQYMNELKKKVSTLESKSSTDDKKISHLSDHVATLQHSVEQYKHRIASVKTQSEYNLKEKEKLMESLVKAKEDLKSTKLQLKIAQEESKKKMSVVIENGEKKEKNIKKEYQSLIGGLEEQMRESGTIINHYQEFIKDLAREVSDLHKKEKALTVKRTEGSDDKVAERARRIAQDTFNLSETEVDQFMNSHNDEGTEDLMLMKSVSQFIEQKGVITTRQQLLTDFISSISNLNSHQ